MQDRYSLSYPLHPEFEELLNSCGSMTRQLQDLGQQLSVELLHEGPLDGLFQRLVILHLNQRPVVAAYSCAQLEAEYFSQLLQNANNLPIGKFLFAADSQVKRLDNMAICHLKVADIQPLRLREALTKYNPSQQLWQRTSVFQYQAEQLKLIEVVLPELADFFN